MKNTMKKMLAVVLVLVMCASVAMPVFAAETLTCPGTGKEHMKSNCSYEFIAKHEKSCETQGYTVYQCKKCSVYFADDIVPSNGGNCTWVVDKAATCTEAGEKHCSVCGAEATIKIVDHNYQWDTNATCGLIGAVRTGTCTVCGHVKVEDLADHKWNAIPTIVKEPVCAPVSDPSTKQTQADYQGLARYTCSKCNATKDVVIYALDDHNNISNVELKEATCTEDGVKMADGATATVIGGKSYGQKCDLCGWTNTVVETAKHTYNETPDRSMPADCTQWGFDLWGCTKCGEHKTVAYAPYGHYLVKTSGADATCGTDVTQIWECQWNECEDKCSATCTHTSHPTADNCIHREVRELKALEHKYVAVVTEATCAAPKKTEEICENCGDVKSSIVEGGVDATKHNWKKDYANSTEPTCTLPGAWLYHCQVCNEYMTESRPATGHNYDKNGDNVVTSLDAKNDPPKCDADGQHDGVLTYVCQNNGCGHTYTEPGEKFSQTNPAHHGGITAANVYMFTKAEAEAKKLPYRDATCTLTDIKSYRCDTCTALNAGVEVTFAVIGAALGHVDANGVAYVPATTVYPTKCGDTTTTAAFDCDRCDFAVAAKTYTTSVKTHNEVIVSENKALTCGNPVTYGCDCKFDVLDETGKVVAKDQSCTFTRTETKTHNYVIEKNSRDNDCELFGFRYNYCEFCEDGYIDMYEYATGHNLVEDKSAYKAPTCGETGKKVEACTNVHTNRVENTTTVTCTKKVTTTIDKLGHLDADGNVIICDHVDEDVLCFRKAEDGGCCNCAATVEKCPGHLVEWETLHEWTTTTIAATCVHYEYKLHVCTVCQYDYTTTGFKLGDHDFSGAYQLNSDGTVKKDANGNPIPDFTNSRWTVKTAASYTAAGVKKFQCRNTGCTKTVEAPYTLTDIKFTLKTDSGIKTGADIVNSGKLLVTVQASAYDIDFYSIDLQLTYDTSKYVYKSFTVSDYTKALLGESGVEVVTVGNATAGTVGIYMANNGKTPTNVSLDKIADKALITLEFDVKADACTATTGTTTGNVKIKSASVLKATGTDKVESNIASASKNVTIQTLGNVTMGTIESSKKLVDDYDARKLVEIMRTANGYSATADINKDGVVNGDDYRALAKYIADGCTYGELCATTK